MTDTQAVVKSAAVRVHSLGKATASNVQASRQLDPFANFYGDNYRIIHPRFNPRSLASLREVNDVLGPAIESMANNIDGFGWELIPTPWITEEQAKSPEAIAEKSRLTRLFEYPNDTMQNLVGLRQDMRTDRESTGCGYWEVIRNALGEIAEIHLLPACTMRLVVRDTFFTSYEELIRNEVGEYETITRQRRFGYFAQMAPTGESVVYFKEFGDPRTINYLDGKETPDVTKAATEIIAFPIYSSYDPYGLPRWLGVMIDILGSRKASAINYSFFDNKMIPPLAIMVSGGSLTPESITRITEIINKEIRGVDNFHKILVIEGMPASVGEIAGEKVSPVKIEIKSLTESIQKDALFQNYQGNVGKAVRKQFRLPGIFTGDNDDYTRATAAESTRVGEEQVFEPERRGFDYIINRTILANMQIKYWTFHSLGAKTSDDTEIVNALAGVAEALPVGVIQEAVAEMRNVPLDDIPPELYTITLNEFRAKNTPAFPAFGADPGSTPKPGDQGEQVVKSLVELRSRLSRALTENGIEAEIIGG